jgi:hypothetical protein
MGRMQDSIQQRTQKVADVIKTKYVFISTIRDKEEK